MRYGPARTSSPPGGRLTARCVAERAGAALLSTTVFVSSCTVPPPPPPMVAVPAPAPVRVTVQQSPAPAPPPSGQAAPQDGKTFSEAEIEQLLAPIALYPDALFAQVLMASTYPLDVVQADRWVKANSNVKDKALEDAMQQQPWDASVKSLTVFPQVLAMMSEKVDWTQKLGDAFLAQEQDVMAAAQKLRGKAVQQGALKDSKEQKVVTDQENGQTVIRIEPADPQVVYVPTYDPTVVYGAWAYPAYPPYYWYPAGYYGGAAFFGFAAGAIVGSALWGNCNWGGGNVNVNVNRYNNFNRSNLQNSNWQHNAQRRGAVPYRDQRTAQQYGRGRSGDAAARDSYRGRADAGQRGNVSNTSFGNRGGTAGRDATGSRNTSAFDASRGGAQVRSDSSRGAQSLGASRSAGGARAGGYSGGGARAGGGARGGGGGRGGGRR